MKYDAVVFDLLTALLDSWTLWNDVAGSPEDGMKWRRRYLEITYGCGAYRPYETLVREAARDVGLPESLGERAGAALGRACALARGAGRAGQAAGAAGRGDQLLDPAGPPGGRSRRRAVQDQWPRPKAWASTSRGPNPIVPC